jgi:hypothetical protein
MITLFSSILRFVAVLMYVAMPRSIYIKQSANPKFLLLDYKRKKMSLSSTYSRQELYTLLYIIYKNYASRAFFFPHVMNFTYF